MENGRSYWLLLAYLMPFCFCASCSDGGWDETNYRYVEVAPNKFVPVKFSTRLPGDLKIKYGNKVLSYKSDKHLNRPQSLMEYDDHLYLLAFDATGIKSKDWKWRCFKQEGIGFAEIPASSYPRSIAILNIWWPSAPPVYYSTRYRTGEKGIKVDQLVLSRECSTEDVHYRHTEQAWLWFMLEVTNDYSKIYYTGDNSGYDSSNSDFVRQCKTKYKPVRLTSMELKPVPKKERNF